MQVGVLSPDHAWMAELGSTWALLIGSADTLPVPGRSGSHHYCEPEGDAEAVQ